METETVNSILPKSFIWEQERLKRDFQTEVQDPYPQIAVNRLRRASGPVQLHPCCYIDGICL